jgi:hypothetical protein
MKKYFLKFTVFVLVVGLFSNCQEDKIMYKGTPALAAFVSDKADLAVLETVVSTVKIGVEISTISSVDRTIAVTIDPKSTALATQYQMEVTTLVVPANSYLGEIVVTGKFAGLVVGQSVKLILNLTSVGDANIEANSKTFTLSIFKSCPLTDASKFNGNYKVAVDDWADYTVGQIVPVVYNVASGTKVFRIMSTNNAYISNPTTSSMVCTLDTATGLVTVASNQTFNYIGWQNILVTGTGSVSPCTGDINLVLKFGTYTGNKFNLVKQ